MIASQAKVANPAVGRIFTKADGVCPSLEYRVRFYTKARGSVSGEGEAVVAAPVQISAWHDVVSPPRWYRPLCNHFWLRKSEAVTVAITPW